MIKLIRVIGNYKSTRRKKHQILADNDKTQSLIPNFFKVSSNNNVIVGRDGGDSDTNGSNKGSGDVLE